MFSANSSQVSDDKLFVEDVFLTALYTGTGSFRGVSTPGMKLFSKGGLVWAKGRTSGMFGNEIHRLYDSARAGNAGGYWFSGPNIQTNSDAIDNSGANCGMYDGSISFGSGWPNNQDILYAAWIFQKAPKFFDVVTFSSNSSGIGTFNHSLGSTPGVVFIKATQATEAWFVYHRSLANTDGLFLNTTDGSTNYGVGANWLSATSSSATVKALGANQNYVAYLFAHDTTSDGIIQCGSFTTDGSGNASAVSLGWEPQWVTIKASSTTSDWLTFDNMRGWTASGSAAILRPNSANNESSNNGVPFPNATGFRVQGLAANATYAYIAIRRGPMRIPTDGTSVFSPAIDSGGTGTRITTNFPVDLSLQYYRPGALSWMAWTRLTGGTNSGTNGAISSTNIRTNNTDAESATSSGDFLHNNVGFSRGGWLAPASLVFYNFRRAPSFFDVVCYTGAANFNPRNHNLTVIPELIITKKRSSSSNWTVVSSVAGSVTLFLNTTAATQGTWSPLGTATTFNPTDDDINATYVSYLFASAPGVSKVGTYTGNGSSQTINCGFAAGARFVMIKRTDSTGNWFVWDTARGIQPAGTNDPFVSLNTTNAENTSNDSLSSQSVGFGVIQNATTDINVSGATYLYLAVA